MEAKRTGVKARPTRRRGVESKWERSFRVETDQSMRKFAPRETWQHEAITLVIGEGAKGLKHATYTPDFLVRYEDEGRPVLYEVKGRRTGEHRAGMVAFRAAAAQWGWLFRFGLAGRRAGKVGCDVVDMTTNPRGSVTSQDALPWILHEPCPTCAGRGCIRRRDIGMTTTVRIEELIAKLTGPRSQFHRRGRMMKPALLRLVIPLILEAWGAREIARETGMNRGTVARLKKLMVGVGMRPPDCACGRVLRHRGRCRVRRGRASS